MGHGEVLLSISYLPAANRLLVVVIKAKNLHSKQLKDLLGSGECYSKKTGTVGSAVM